MTTPANESLLLSVDETAKRLSVSKNTVFRLLRSGDLASMTIGAKRLIPRQELDRFIHERIGTRTVTKETTS